MFAVIFEVQPKKESWNQYLELAKFLKPELEKIDGFIDNERFKNQQGEESVLSLSTWRDEKAVVRWRTLAVHHGVQEKGRSEVFTNYHLRVGEITSDTHVPAGNSLAEQRLDETEVGDAKTVTITELIPKPGYSLAERGLDSMMQLPTGMAGLFDQQIFESIYNQGKLLLLLSWKDAAAASDWRPPTSADRLEQIRHRTVRIVRDYGMFDRREAPQYYPPIKGG
jgi:heme-degrading monooxygenase HmoA